MNLVSSHKELNKKFETENYIVLLNAELTDLLTSSCIVFEQDTHLRDFIRILKVQNLFYLQEKTNLGEIIIRRFDSEADALKLLNERMEIYDKMWDGCGCKINYYE